MTHSASLAIAPLLGVAGLIATSSPLNSAAIPSEEPQQLAQDIENETPFHVEGLYKVQLSENITITPGFIWLLNPNQDADHDGAFIGTLRTTFSF